jgi:hypothetical protein
VAASVPVITTPRLILRAPALRDDPACEAVFTSPRAAGMSGPFDADNAVSITVATRLGARRDPAAEAAMGDPGLVIHRHFGLRGAT